MLCAGLQGPAGACRAPAPVGLCAWPATRLRAELVDKQLKGARKGVRRLPALSRPTLQRAPPALHPQTELIEKQLVNQAKTRGIPKARALRGGGPGRMRGLPRLVGGALGRPAAGQGRRRALAGSCHPPAVHLPTHPPAFRRR